LEVPAPSWSSHQAGFRPTRFAPRGGVALIVGSSVTCPKGGMMLIRYVIVSISSGILFGVLDGLIHANRLAQRLYEVYKPLAREAINPLAGVVIDLAYGFVMAGVFLLLYRSLPGETGLIKGISFALLVWFFRVVMYNASQWVMFKIPVETLFYALVAGLGEMLVLGMLYGLTLKPAA
jgi:hypothetical protein